MTEDQAANLDEMTVKAGQCISLALATVATLLFVCLISKLFGSHKTPLYARNFGNMEIGVAGVVSFLIAMPYILDAISLTLGGKASKRPILPRSFTKTLRKNSRLTVALWAGSIFQYITMGYLVMRSGGLDKSPYAAMLLTYFTLTPAIMEGVGSILVLLLVAVVSVAFLGFVAPDRQLPASGHDYGHNVYTWVILGTLVLALGIAYLKKYLEREPVDSTWQQVLRRFHALRARADKTVAERTMDSDGSENG